MTAVRWRLVNALNCDYTYGYLTKSGRIALKIPKSHANDAFVIAGGKKQKRAEPLVMEQVRRNNRSLEKFYDAKYRDTRTGKTVSGQELFSGRRTRNKELGSENLHRYRGHKVKKGQRRIRRQRYRFQPKDNVRYRGEKYQVKGMQNLGRYVKLSGLPKPVKAVCIDPSRWRKGICAIL